MWSEAICMSLTVMPSEGKYLCIFWQEEPLRISLNFVGKFAS
jgi:hypothetical protein